MQEINQFLSSMERMGIYPLRESDIKDTDGKSILIKDRQGRERIYYSLTLRADFSYGNFYCCKMGEGGYWHSKIGKNISDDVRATREKLIEEQKAKIELEQEQTHLEAKDRAIKEWKNAQEYSEHAYLANKGILPHKTRLSDKGEIIIPAVDNQGAIWTVQRISGDGEKTFLWKGKKKGNFHPIGWSPKSEKPELIIICEGFATGASIYEALALPVAVAFDAGNLIHVGQGLRKIHKDAVFVYAADNDAWNFKEPRAKQVDGIDKESIPATDSRWSVWREKGYLFNDGIEKAKSAGVKTSGYVIWPEFNDPDEKLTDFNDLKDYDKIRELFAPLLVSPFLADETPIADDVPSFTPSVNVEQIAVDTRGGSLESVQSFVVHGSYFETDDVEHVDEKPVKKRSDGKPEWYNDVIWKDERTLTPEPKSLHNRMLWLRNGIGKNIQYNEFSDEITLIKALPWENKEKFFVRSLSDEDIINFTAYFEQQYRLAPDTTKMDQSLRVVAKENTVNPVMEYFESLKWDGVARLNTWLQRYLGATDQPYEYLARVGTMWLVAGAARAYKAGTAYQHMLVLEGKQNIGKSRALKTLSTFGVDKEVEYFTDGLQLSAINNPRSCQIMAGALIVEFAELAEMDKIGELTLRGWITKTEDKMIKPYAKTVSTFPRRCILAGSTNEDNWLRDSQGFRRYHPVKCLSIDIDALKTDKEQLWAEAVYLYKAGYSIYLPDNDPVYSMAITQQQARQAVDALDDVFDRVLEGVEWTTYADLWHRAGMSINMLDEVAQTRMRKYLRKNDWRNEVCYRLSKSKNRVWLRSDIRVIVNITPEPEDRIRMEEVIDVLSA